MKRISLGLLVVVLLLGGCTSSNMAPNEIEKLKAIIKKQGQTINELNLKLSAQENKLVDFFPIYGLDYGAQKEEINFYTQIPHGLELKDKIVLLASALSRFKFSNAPVEFMAIENLNGKKIARINLEEASDDRGSWQNYYFQGSTGGQATTLTLSKSFLQPDYKGDWIDGVEFYYKGEPMGEWDHVSLQGVIERTAE